MNLFSTLKDLIDGGGIMMWPLLLMNFALWALLFKRSRTLYSGELKEAIREIDSIKFHSNAEIELEIGLLRDILISSKTYIHIIVTASPLMGLLGTVMGMIETFESLGDMSLFTQGGGIAGGISQALITTQMGLAVAIPGLLVGRYLYKKQEELGSEVDGAEHRARACFTKGTLSEA